MANKERGQITIEAGGETYRLSFSINAMCELEDVFERPFLETAQWLQDTIDAKKLPEIQDIRKLLWGAFTDHNEGFKECDKATLRKVGVIASEYGLEGTMELIGRAFQAAFPDPENSGDAGKTKASKTISAG